RVSGHNPLLADARELPRIALAPYWNMPQQPKVLYRPLTTLTSAIDRMIAGGLHPRWFHLVNILIHGLATFLVTLLASELLPGVAPPVFVGLVFACTRILVLCCV